MNKFLNFLGLAKRSGNLVEGYSKCDDLRNKIEFFLFIISTDASEKSTAKFIKHCTSNNIKYIYDFTKEELGEPLGRPEVKILGVNDEKMAKKLLSLYNENQNLTGGDFIVKN